MPHFCRAEFNANHLKQWVLFIYNEFDTTEIRVCNAVKFRGLFNTERTLRNATIEMDLRSRCVRIHSAAFSLLFPQAAH